MKNEQRKNEVIRAGVRAINALTDIEFQIFDLPEIRTKYQDSIDELKKRIQMITDKIGSDKNLKQ